MESAIPSVQTVKRRKVFYIPGYDPIHPRRYRELYRSEGAEQASISGYRLELGAKIGTGGPFGWHVTGQIEGGETDADFEVLVWSDIVKTSMNQGIGSTYGQLVRTSATYIFSGALGRLMKLRKGPVIAALYPVVFLILQLILALLAALGLGTVLALLHPWLAWGGLAIVPLLLMWFRKHDNRLFAYYLMHDYAYSARSKGANPPELEARIAEFEDAIATALEGDFDEVLVIGHSSGAHLGVSILADLIRSGRAPAQEPALGFLTLGQVVPMVSFLPDAHRLRADLHYLSVRDELFWLDVTAPGDGCAFALCDPVAVSGVAPEGQKWPLVISAAFTQTLSEARWQEMKRRYFRLHFQYLCAFDRPGDYDYFRITAGPKTLAERFAGRKPSQSRITRAVNRYVSMKQ